MSRARLSKASTHQSHTSHTNPTADSLSGAGCLQAPRKNRVAPPATEEVTVCSTVPCRWCLRSLLLWVRGEGVTGEIRAVCGGLYTRGAGLLKSSQKSGLVQSLSKILLFCRKYTRFDKVYIKLMAHTYTYIHIYMYVHIHIQDQYNIQTYEHKLFS